MINLRCLRQFIVTSLLILPLWLGLTCTALADKVTLDPSHWGLEEGKACISCHQKASAGLTHDWQTAPTQMRA